MLVQKYISHMIYTRLYVDRIIILEWDKHVNWERGLHINNINITDVILCKFEIQTCFMNVKWFTNLIAIMNVQMDETQPMAPLWPSRHVIKWRDGITSHHFKKWRLQTYNFFLVAPNFCNFWGQWPNQLKLVIYFYEQFEKFPKKYIGHRSFKSNDATWLVDNINNQVRFTIHFDDNYDNIEVNLWKL